MNYLIYVMTFFYWFKKLNVLKLASEDCTEIEREKSITFLRFSFYLSNNYLLNLAEVNKKFQFCRKNILF